MEAIFKLHGSREQEELPDEARAELRLVQHGLFEPADQGEQLSLLGADEYAERGDSSGAEQASAESAGDKKPDKEEYKVMSNLHPGDVRRSPHVRARFTAIFGELRSRNATADPRLKSRR